MMKITSRVPHLAKAIAERKQLQADAISVSRCTCGRRDTVYHVSGALRYASSKPQPPPSALRRPSPMPKPLSARRNPERPMQEARNTDQNDAYTRPNEETLRLTAHSEVLKKRGRRLKVAWSVFGIVLVAYTGYFMISSIRDAQIYNMRFDKLSPDADVSDRWNDKSRDFDAEVDASEKAMFMKRKRRRLVSEAYGDVLEVSVGTGRNMELYDTRPYSASEDISYGRDKKHMITSLTFNDQSPVMVKNAQRKWAEKQQALYKADRFTGQVNWVVGDAGVSNVLPRPPGGYDTIVQSMGICSMADPEKFLRHLGKLARQPGEVVQNSSPEKFRKEEEQDGKGGRIFLLEHGRGYYDWLNKYLDTGAPMHADRYGCWFNKDIGRIVQESGLIVERVRRYNFGTTWEVVLRPAPTPIHIEELPGKTNPQDPQATAWDSLWSSISSFWK